MFRTLLSTFLPHGCLVCGRTTGRLSSKKLLCRGCTPSIPYYPPPCVMCGAPFFPFAKDSDPHCFTCRQFPLPFRSLRSIWVYEFKARDLIRAMKYRPSLALCRWIGERAGEALPALFPHYEWDCIIPTPSSWQNFSERLFHPCHEIAKTLALQLNLPLGTRQLRHKRAISAQSKLSHHRRLKAAFQSLEISSGRVREKRILLIDDVLTTGATACAAATLLKNSGAASVDLFVMAEAPEWYRFRHALWKNMRSHHAP